jgi:adenylate kinase
MCYNDDVAVIEMGNLLEEEVRRNTPLGREIKIKPYKTGWRTSAFQAGHRVLSARLNRIEGSILLFDGFPRSTAQIGMFFRSLKEHRLEFCAVVILNLYQETALKRISGRHICTQCGTLYNIYLQPPQRAGICDRCGSELVQREDDRLEVVRERLMTYERETLPVVEFFPQLIRASDFGAIRQRARKNSFRFVFGEGWKRLRRFSA